jgi:4'-phosphopantetheinyl transferase EntD
VSPDTASADELQNLIDASLPLRQDVVLRTGAITGRIAVQERLLPEEAVDIAGASAHRRREFATGRNLAREAMIELGRPAVAISRGPDREPVWPSGITGSITHTRDTAAVVVATTERVASVGIDLETTGRVSEAMLGRILTPAERSLLDDGDARLPDVVFSAKEAGYKATRPLAGRYIGFQEAAVDVDWARGRFRFRYLGTHEPNRAMERGEGYFLFCGPYVLSLVIIPANN